MDSTNYLILDFETTGLDCKDWPIQIGYCILKPNGEITSPMEQIIRLPLKARLRYYRSEAYRIHKITWKSTRDWGGYPDGVITMLHSYCAGNIGAQDWPKTVKIAGQNIGFDWMFLKKLYRMSEKESRRLGFPIKKNPFDYHLIDIPTLGYELVGEGSSGKLEKKLLLDENLIDHRIHSILKRVSHNAAWDAYRSALVLRELLKIVRKSVSQ